MNKRHKQLLDEIEREHNELETKHRDSRVLIVDGMNLFIRTFSAIPTLNEDGQHVGGLTGFLQSLGATIRMFSPTRVIVVFDGKGGSKRRRGIYSEYKERRAIKSKLNRVAGFEDMADEQKAMKHQLLRIYYYLSELPVTVLAIDDVEADDVIAYLTSYFNEEVIISSNDKDFLQLVNDRVSVYSPIKKKLYNPQNLIEEYGIWCENFPIYKALKGDRSDNIKPISGFGDKTILKQFPMLAERRKVDLDEFEEFCKLYDGKSKTMLQLQSNMDEFFRNYSLVQLTETSMPATITSNIRNVVDGDITEMNKSVLSELYVSDKIQSSIPNWNSWLIQSFGNINTLKDKRKDEG